MDKNSQCSSSSSSCVLVPQCSWLGLAFSSTIMMPGMWWICVDDDDGDVNSQIGCMDRGTTYSRDLLVLHSHSCLSSLSVKHKTTKDGMRRRAVTRQSRSWWLLIFIMHQHNTTGGYLTKYKRSLFVISLTNVAIPLKVHLCQCRLRQVQDRRGRTDWLLILLLFLKTLLLLTSSKLLKRKY